MQIFDWVTFMNFDTWHISENTDKTVLFKLLETNQHSVTITCKLTSWQIFCEIKVEKLGTTFFCCISKNPYSLKSIYIICDIKKLCQWKFHNATCKNCLIIYKRKIILKSNKILNTHINSNFTAGLMYSC